MSFALVIKPHDVLFFRNGRPFSAGSDTRAQSLFPPTPFTIQGALRARVFFSSGVSPSDYVRGSTPHARRLQQLIGPPAGNYGKLRLRGPFPARRENDRWVCYFPVPADVVRAGEAYRLLRPLQVPLRSNLPGSFSTPWLRTVEHVETVQGWLSEEELRNYMAGQPPVNVLPESEFVVRESRFGISLVPERRAPRESYMYLAEFLRMREDVAFWVEVDEITHADLGGQTGFLRLGGEARAAYYRTESLRLGPLLSPPDPLPRRFKVALLTPAWFGGGWQPQDGDWKQFITGTVRLVSAIVPRYRTIGGVYVVDLPQQGDSRRTLRRFVPAGSVYFFEHDGIASWRGRPFTETPPGEGDFGQIGFGTCVIGLWDYT